MKSLFIFRTKRNGFLGQLILFAIFLLLFAACVPAQTEPEDTCECELTSGVIDDSAADGSTAVVNVDTCMEPRPCIPDTLEVQSYDDDSASLTKEMETELEGIGRIYALLDIKPSGKFWDPAIIVTVVLNEPAPRDNFSLSIFRWNDSDDHWQKEGTAIARKKDDPTAEGRITHTSLFAFVDETDKVAEAPEEERVVVPDVAGLPLDEARELLREEGFAVSVESRDSDSIQEDTVISMQPRAGSRAAPGSRVTLSVSTGPEEVERVRVPNVIGFSLDDAAQTLEEAGLFLSGSRDEESDAEEGSVIDADPRVGMEVEVGTGVYLVLAIPVPVQTVDVPDLIGWQLDDATDELFANDLALNREIGEESSEAEGTVIGMQPAPGTEVAVGTAVTLYYAIPIPCFVPNVIGDPVESAADMLNNSGCLYAGEWIAIESSQPEGDVIDTDPGPDSQVEPGTAVTLYYAIPERCVVPDLIGLFEEEARQRIAEAGCTVRDVFETEGYYPYDEPGMVADTAPSAGTEIDSGSGIDLYVASDRVEVPDVTGNDVEKAKEILVDQRLEIGEIIEVEGEYPYEPGDVLYTDPEAGAVVDVWTAVNLFVVQAGIEQNPVNDYNGGRDMGYYAAEELGAYSAIIIYNSGSAFSSDRMQGFVDAFSEMGGELSSIYDLGSYGLTDMSAVLSTMYAAGKQPDIFYIPIEEPTASLIINQAIEIGFESAFLDAYGKR
jgi:beta-lactam-binding protein with PASTA domain